MRQELDDLLCKLAPNLYRDRRAGAHKSCFAFGFEHGDGWFGLLLEASLALEALGLPDLKAAQVKEKFGGLRLYVDGETDEVEAIISRAEERSYVECEECGAAGKSTGRGWIRTLCETHDKTQAQDED